ncbi:MAG: hypothetical protein U1D70_16270 [Methylobacter sp.]|nr:hypothetical protein [Methylobacter sp.]MDP2428678.1 hypothetical protein [Methylobacter sp.]MDP3055158.1 hypothetical protein [Methylobacter sp.]MDP3360546.1 hypothetical protein [Methylobacter sp.]MDZ4220560.1 hypothetical protein [Methylobacter sp.]
MVKRRTPPSALAANRTEPTQEEIEAFAAAAEGGSNTVKIQEPELNQNAIRDFKAMRVPFNEYEFRQLELACKLSGRSKLNFMRYAMLKLAKEIQSEEN